MKAKIITTNVRIEENDLKRYKKMAAELGLSLNQYIKLSVEKETNRRQVEQNDVPKRKIDIWNFGDQWKKYKKLTPMGLSEDDEAVYG